MKFIKQLTCLIACFVVLSSSFMIGYAVDDDVIYTADDLIDLGAYVDEYGAYVLPSDNLIQPFLLTQPNYPNFDINKINWSTMPGYIQDIVYSSLDDLGNALSDTSTRVPFVMIRINSDSYFTIFAGYNVCVTRNNSSSGTLYLSSIRPFSYLSGSSVGSEPSCFDNACLFSAQFRLSDYSQTSDWSLITPTRFDSVTLSEQSNRTTIYNYLWLGSMGSVMDLYFYGANLGTDKSYVSSVNYPANDNSSLISIAVDNNGFFAGNYIMSSSSYNFIYCNNFTPKTIEQYQQQLLQEQNNKLDNIFGATGNPDGIVDDYNKAESDLVDDYNPDNLEDDLDIELDSSALDFIWDLFDDFVTADDAVFTLFLSLLSIGIIALILGR